MQVSHMSNVVCFDSGSLLTWINLVSKLAKLKIIYDQDLIGEYDLLAIKDINNDFSQKIK